jgi:hypothetical protein
MLLTDAKALKPLVRVAAALCLLLGAAHAARAQSSDPNFPAPVFSEEVSGRIAPRDVGDPRRTRHFYTFRGVEGDLVITLESTELTGDVDLFTASTQRPLLKFTLYGGSASRVSKSVYVRAEQALVLRVEARAAGEAEGSYRIRFGGAFAPAPAGLAEAPPPPTLAEPEAERRPGTRRVTSTGARIEEPRTETAAAEEPAPTPTPTPAETTARPTRRETTSRRGRARPPSRRQPAPAATAPADTAGAETAGRETPSTSTPAEATPAEATPEAERPATPRPTRGARRRGSRPANRSATAEERAAADAAAQPPAASAPAEAQPAPPGQRLVIVSKDGTIIVREMSKVRRVMIDSGQLVVTLKDGKVIRHQLSNVERMSIEP